jgi:hypothetical protein
MDNPQAFPVWVNDPEYSRGGYVDGGMSLRDYFAAKALQGLMVRSWGDQDGKVPADIYTIWATSSYKLADAMLKARGE